MSVAGVNVPVYIVPGEKEVCEQLLPLQLFGKIVREGETPMWDNLKPVLWVCRDGIALFFWRNTTAGPAYHCVTLTKDRVEDCQPLHTLALLAPLSPLTTGQVRQISDEVYEEWTGRKPEA